MRRRNAMHILIPCKSLASAKSRLAGCLDPQARRAFCRDLLIRTLQQAVTLTAPSHIYIVTSDNEAAGIAAGCGIAQTPDPGGGLNAALEAARSALLAVADTDALLILPIDLPFASADAIASVSTRSADVVIVPDESGTGTNLLLLRAASLQRLPFTFGVGSYAAHVASAQTLGLSTETVRDGRLSFDIDEPSHYAAWRARCGRQAQDRSQDRLTWNRSL